MAQDEPRLQGQPDDNDGQWKTALRRGNDAAWERVYKECFPKIKYTLEVAHSCPPEKVRDIFQDAAIVLVQNLQKGEHTIRGRILPWLKSVAVYIWLNELKKLPRQHKLEDYLLREGLIVQSEVRLPEIADIEKMEKEPWEKALQELTEGDRQIITLYYLEDLDYKEIATYLNIKVDAAKKRRCRAIARLKGIMFPLFLLIALALCLF